MTDETEIQWRHASFSGWLRTGRLIPLAASTEGIEAKFNPWHDPEDGRFTFAGQGNYFGLGSSATEGVSRYSKPPTQNQARRRNLDLVNDAASAPTLRQQINDPRNHSVYIVEKGDNLSRLAATRKGLSASDLAWINGIPVNGVLRVGQKLKVPTQAWLDFNKGRWDKVNRATFYLAMHGDKPPIPRTPEQAAQDVNLANLPSIGRQIDSELKTVVLGNYSYKVDMILRPRDIRGTIPGGPAERRSRSAQARAGGKDRLRTDDGGHYVAARFGGSPHPLNHFTQNAGVNRGQYRAIEDRWAKARDAGHKVFIHIVPHYRGLSLRPYEVFVEWVVGNQQHSQIVPNEKQGK